MQKSPSVHHHTNLLGYIFATKACINNWKKSVSNGNISFICLCSMVNFGPLTAEICWRVWGTPANFNGFCILLCYCSDVAQQKSTRVSCRIHFASKSCILLYSQHYCTTLEQRPSVKLCGVILERELRNFCRGRHLYLAGRPSRWASATF